ncbi:MAG: hypothetical protein ABIC95_06245 [archaeon]
MHYHRVSEGLVMVILLVLVLALIGCAPEPPPEETVTPMQTMDIDGITYTEVSEVSLKPKYDPVVYENAQGDRIIMIDVEGHRLVYPYSGENEAVMRYLDQMMAENETVIAWWSLAGQVMGQTGRTMPVIAPTDQLIEDGIGYAASWDSDVRGNAEELALLAAALVSNNSFHTYQYLASKGTRLIVIPELDPELVSALFDASGIDPQPFMAGETFTQAGRDLVIYRMMRGQGLANFKKLYHDAHTRIYLSGTTG